MCVSCTEQNLLYTLYSIPNTVLPFFGGAFVDRFGINTALVLFSSFILLGQVIFAAGSSFASFNLMLVRSALHHGARRINQCAMMLTLLSAAMRVVIWC